MVDQSGGARSKIISAFNRLILFRRQLKPRVADLLGEAGVARSTFYEHFNSRDSLLLTAIREPLGIVADAVAGTIDAARLSDLLEHLRENRRGAIDVLSGALSTRVVRTLAALIDERLKSATDTKKAALHLAEMQIGFIRLWLTGETPYAVEDLAALMIRSATAQRALMLNHQEN